MLNRNALKISFQNLFNFIFLTNLLFAAVSCAAQTGDVPVKGFTFQIDDRTDYVNVMGSEMPALPEFPALTKKAGYVRGYVKNVLGEPIAGAKLGLKSARFYDSYIADSAETDANGYYEIKIPTGGARFDYAGLTRNVGRGNKGAIGLHPADGNLSESYPATGGVENFVALPYGIADADGIGKNPKYRGNYYGGSFMIRYFIAPPGQDLREFPGWFAPGSEIVISLIPVAVMTDGSNFAHGFQISKKVEESSLGEFYICNVPLGEYQIIITDANGRALRMKQKNPTNSSFGIQPQETSGGSASLIFNPLSADAKTAVASRGNWTDLEIIVERP